MLSYAIYSTVKMGHAKNAGEPFSNHWSGKTWIAHIYNFWLDPFLLPRSVCICQSM